MHCLIFTLILNSFIVPIISEVNDEIHDLPGLNEKPKFRQYSGYLNASEDKLFHYWFVESQSRPATDPVVLWLNGGPGCSSLNGLFKENGPFRVTKDGKNLTYDQFSWNTLANVLYLESPAGVGYSYRHLNPEKLVTNDYQTAKDNYLALLNFFQKFPQFKQNDFYITGESYAGVYIPTLALEILHDMSKINLKGVAIGNGYFNLTIIQNSRFYLAHYHGLIDTDNWNKLIDKCCSCEKNVEICDFTNFSKSCAQLSEDVFFNATIVSNINQYNIYDECSHSFSIQSLKYSPFLIDMALRLNQKDFQFLQTLPQNEWYDNSIEECVGDSFEKYLNDPKVRDAIHIPKSLSDFTLCNEIVLRDYEKLIDVRKQFVELLSKYKLDPFIVYNGDLDTVCDFIGNQMFLDGLEIPVIEKHRKWILDGKTAGFVKRYRGLTFVTVRGAGHFVPSDKPGPALHLIKTLIGKAKLE